MQTPNDPAATAPLAVRAAILAFGVLVYAAFLGTFTYFIGFVMDVLVPKSIEDGPEGSAGKALLVDGGLVGLFAAQHLIMARLGFKRWWTRIIPPAAERSTFVLASTAILAATMLFWRPLPELVWEVGTPALATGLHAVAWLGWGTLLITTFLIDHFDLFGLRQAVLYLRGLPCRDRPFQERGFYRFVRHPLYLGTLVAVWAAPAMSGGRLTLALLFTVFVLVGIQTEERMLLVILKDDYAAYRRRVPMLLPVPRRTRRTRGGEC